MRSGLDDTPSIPEFLAKELSAGSRVGIDPFVHSIEAVNDLSGRHASADCSVVPIFGPNPVDCLWAQDHPMFPNGKVRLHDVVYAGRSVGKKSSDLREAMRQDGAY